MRPPERQMQNIEEALDLLEEISGHCPSSAENARELVRRIATSTRQGPDDDRVRIGQAGEGVLEADDYAKTHTTWGWTGRYTVTTLAERLFPGRELDRDDCDDIDELVRLLSTLTHEYFHRKCLEDPEAAQGNLALLEGLLEECLPEDFRCRSEIEGSLEGEIENERQLAGGEGTTVIKERLKTLLFTGGTGVLAGGVAAKIGVAVFGTAWLGPVAIGVAVGAAAYAWYNPCE